MESDSTEKAAKLIVAKHFANVDDGEPSTLTEDIAAALRAMEEEHARLTALLDARERERDAARTALKKIAAMKHRDRSCSLEAQGYVHDDCLVIAATDSIADIAIIALAEPQTPRQVWLKQVENNE